MAPRRIITTAALLAATPWIMLPWAYLLGLVGDLRTYLVNSYQGVGQACIVALALWMLIVGLPRFFRVHWPPATKRR